MRWRLWRSSGAGTELGKEVDISDLCVARRDASPHFTKPAFQEALRALGDFELRESAEDLPQEEVLALIRDADVLLTGHGTLPVPVELSLYPGTLKYICHLTGTLQGMVPPTLVESGLLISHWGGAPANEMAEASLTLLLTLLKYRAWIASRRSIKPTMPRFVVGQRGVLLVPQEIQIPRHRAARHLELPHEVAAVGQIAGFGAFAHHLHHAADSVMLGSILCAHFF